MKNFLDGLSLRIHNYAFWVSIFALIPLLAQAFGFIKIPDNYNELVNAILTLLVAAGIINNPTTNNKGFGDDTQSKEIK